MTEEHPNAALTRRVFAAFGRDASASDSESVSSRSSCSSSCRARAVWIAGSRSCSRNGFTR